jgi:HAD superfamily hydrolase (TIGR01509 family)
MKTIKKRVKAVIFDLDGTITNTEHLWDEATRVVLNKRGFKYFTKDQHEFLKSLSGIGLIRSAEVIKKEFNLTDTVEALAKEAETIANNLFAGGLEFIDGFETFHKKLQEHNIPTSIATNAGKQTLITISKQMRLDQFFGANQYCIAMVGNKPKPDPAVFLHAAKKLYASPEECIVFEDSLFGFQAAKAAGMTCIAIKNNLNKENLHLANSAITSYNEAEKALKALLSPKSRS